MFAQIAVTLDGKPLDPTVVYDIKAPWPDHQIEIVYVTREEFAAERMDEPEGKYFVVLHGKRYGGGRWEFRQVELDSLVTEALRNLLHDRTEPPPRATPVALMTAATPRPRPARGRARASARR